MYFERLGANSLADSYSQNASSERVINTLLSGMFRVNYVLMDKYMVTASIRAERFLTLRINGIISLLQH